VKESDAVVPEKRLKSIFSKTQVAFSKT